MEHESPTNANIPLAEIDNTQPGFSRRALLRRFLLLAAGTGGVATLLKQLDSPPPQDGSPPATVQLEHPSLEANVQPSTSPNNSTTPGQPSPTATSDPEVSNATRREILAHADRAEFDARWALVETIGGPLSAVVAVLGSGGALLRWQRDRHALARAQIEEREAQERHRREEQAIERHREDAARLYNITQRMGATDLWTRTGAAIELLTFTQTEYQAFHQEIFNTVVQYLKHRQVDPDNPKPDSFYDEIMTSFVSLLPSLRKSTLEEVCKKLGKGPSELTVNEWHTPRIDASEISADGFSFTGIDFTGLILRGSSWTQATIDSSDLMNVDLRHATLTKAQIQFSHANGVILNGANLDESSILRTQLCEADLAGAHFNNATLRQVELIKANLRHTSWAGATCNDVVFPYSFKRPDPKDFGTDARGRSLMPPHVLDTMNVTGLRIINPIQLPGDVRQELIGRGAKFE